MTLEKPPSVLFVNSMTLVFVGLAVTVLSYSSSVFAARNLGVTATGEFFFATHIMGYLLLVSGLGIPAIGQREIAKYPNLTTQFAGLIITTQFLFACFGYALVIGIALAYPSSQTHLVAILGINLLLMAIRPYWILRGHQKMTASPLVSLLWEVLQVALVLIFVTGESGEYTYAWIWVIGVLLKTAFDWWYTLNKKLIEPAFSGFAFAASSRY